MGTTTLASIASAAPVGGGGRHGLGVGLPDTGQPAATAMVAFGAVGAHGSVNFGVEQFAGARHGSTRPLAVYPGMAQTVRGARATLCESHPQPVETPPTPDALALNTAARSPGWAARSRTRGQAGRRP